MSDRPPRQRGRLGLPELDSSATPQPVAAGPALVRVPGGAGNAEMTLAARIGSLVQRRQAQEDALAEGEAREAGLAAGDAAPGAAMEGGGAIYRTAFNRAALEGGARRLEIGMRTRLEELAREHEADPEAFGRAAAAYRDGLAADLSGEVRTRFLQGYDTLAIPFANQARQLLERRVGDQAVAAFNEALPRRVAAIDRLGRASVRDPAALAALRLEETNALEDLARLGPRTAFEVGGRRFEADPTRAGALSVQQIVETRQRILDAGVAATAMGAFEAGPKTEAWVNGWVRRELSTEGAGLTPDLVRRIEREMRVGVAEREAQSREAQGRAWGALQERIGAINASLALTGRPNDTITDAELRAAGRTPEQITAFRNAVRFGEEAFAARRQVATATPAELDALEARVMPGGDLFALNPGGAARVAELLAGRRQGAARADVEARVADARAAGEAGNADAAARVTPEGARAAGLTPEQAAAANAAISLAEDRGAIRRLGATGTPEEIASLRGALAIEGPDAAENAARLEALEQALRHRRQGLAERPADYVQAEFAPVGEAWRAALADPARTGAAIAATLDAQERLGVPAHGRQAVPAGVAQAIVSQLGTLATPGERLQLLERTMAAVPEEDAKRQLMRALETNGLDAGLAVAALVQRRAGAPIGARVASELAVDAAKLPVEPSERRAIAATVTAVWEADDRLGGLRRAQYEATRSATFLEESARERALLDRIGLVRATPSASVLSGTTNALSSSAAEEAYRHLFGGSQVVNRPVAGVLVAVPAGMDGDRIAAGLEQLARRRVADAAGGGAAGAALANTMAGDLVWVNGRDNRDFVLFSRGAGLPLTGPDGAPIRATPEAALAVAVRPDGSPLRVDETEAQRRAQIRRSQELGRQERLFEQQRRGAAP